jgi:type IV pilus assembly protein PilM
MVALIDVGASTTSILIAHDGVPQFVRIIPAGGDDLTQALKAGLEIGSFEAEELKRTLTFGADSTLSEEPDPEISKCACAQCSAELAVAGDPHAAEILQAITSDLLNGLRNTIKYYTNIRPQDPVSQILLTGGGSQLAGFSTALAEMTRVPVINADPFEVITLPRKGKSKKSQQGQSSMAVALGLALRTLA